MCGFFKVSRWNFERPEKRLTSLSTDGVAKKIAQSSTIDRVVDWTQDLRLNSGWQSEILQTYQPHTRRPAKQKQFKNKWQGEKTIDTYLHLEKHQKKANLKWGNAYNAMISYHFVAADIVSIDRLKLNRCVSETACMRFWGKLILWFGESVTGWIGSCIWRNHYLSENFRFSRCS